ncbi:MAG: aminotransferase class I/II-fold pyridoxal phosphate-dependent enzyme [Lachnospiraceae bacterium]|nr:aminotransferase class I/II-fold pyridoxal phosphate-dependent enzyme [Lachnospiraceae bacterium]
MTEQIKAKEQFHGSDLEKIEKYFGIPKEKITSFGANVNPLGLSPLMREGLLQHIDVVTSYPDPAYTQLRRHIAAYTGCQPEQILVGNGCTELISLFVQIRKPKKALIVSPTYSEYECEIHLNGGEVVYYALQEKEDFQLNVNDFTQTLSEGYDLCVICNPNNPTSTATEQEDMRQVLSCCNELGVFVMIDETYAEFAPEKGGVSCVGLLNEFQNFTILRGVSKFFAAPGLRLGYAMTGNLALLQKIQEDKNPWTLNSLAEVAGSYMFRDTAYIEQTRNLISSERERIYQELLTWKHVKVYRPHANFILVRILREDVTSYDVFLHAIRRGLMLRDCSSFPGLEDGSFFRFCFMMPEKNTELLACLHEILEG